MENLILEIIIDLPFITISRTVAVLPENQCLIVMQSIWAHGVVDAACLPIRPAVMS